MPRMARDIEVVDFDNAQNVSELKRLMKEQMIRIQRAYRNTFNDIVYAQLPTIFAHLHDEQTLEHDGVDSDGGAFPFNTTGPVTFNQLLIVNDKAAITTIGGIAVKLTNNTGSPSVEGQVVETDDTDENSYKTADANCVDAIGVVFNAGVADGSEVWIVHSGIAEVLLDAGGCVHHDRLICSATAGSADVSNAPAVAVHFQEIGHALETVVGAGLAKAMIHLL